MPDPTTPSPTADPERLWSWRRNAVVATAVAGAFALLLTLTFSGMDVLSSIRGYVHGEGTWSKAQKRSVVALHRYARSGAESDWSDYVATLDVTLGGRLAREELSREDPDMELVREGFTRGQIPQEFIGGMSLLFRRFGSVDFVSRAIAIWTEGDEQIDRLRELAGRLRAERTRGEPDPAAIAGVLESINAVDSRLTNLEQDFSNTLNAGAFQVERVLTWVIIAIAMMLLVATLLGLRVFYRQVRRRERSIEQSQARYRSLFEETVAGTTVTAPDGTFLAANRAFARMLGFDDPEALIGRSALDFYVEPRDRDGFLESLRREGTVSRNPLQSKTRDGRRIWLITTAALLRDPEDGSERILTTCIDTTEQKELEGRLQRSGRLEAMGQLAGGIAHDFNNLLTAIQGNAELLTLELQDTVDSDELRSLTDDIVRSSRTATELTRQLLTFSRGDPREAGVVDLATLVRGMRAILERLVPESIDLHAELPDTPVLVEASPAQLEQVVLNLVLNARDAMPAGGSLVVTVQSRSFTGAEHGELRDLPAGDYGVLQVSDGGGGISEEIRGRLFEPFFTTRTGGSGMGLATVYGIVSQAGGAIRVESEPGSGATFQVLLPLVSEAPVEENPAGRSRPGKESGRVVALVEDDDPVRRAIRRMLESGGYEVRESPDPTKALSTTDWAQIDLLVTDMMMPGMNGAELARRVFMDHPDLPVLFVSGFSGYSLEKLDFAGHLIDSLAKPLSTQLLLERVSALLERSRERVAPRGA